MTMGFAALSPSYAAFPQRRSVAIAAPSASALSLAQTTDGTTGLVCPAKVAKPQSVPAMTRSRPTMSDEPGVLDKIRRRVDAARHQDFVIGDFGALQIFPFMRMARVGRLEQERLRPRPHAGVEHLRQRDVVRVRSLVIAPADVETQRGGRNVARRVADGGDVALGDPQEFR